MNERFKMSVDPNTYRHSMNGFPVVLHCHHYLTLYTRTAEQFSAIDGPRILSESMEDAVRPILDDLFTRENITSPHARFEAGASFFSFMGLGAIQSEGDATGGRVTLRASHLDQGWIKKWGKNDKPINYVTGGFIVALFAATFGKSPRSYSVIETESIVTGAPQSAFIVKSA